MTAVSLNLNSLSDIPLVEVTLAELGLPLPLPFIEIPWDNYCHLDPVQLSDHLAPLSTRMAFTVRSSKFLERTSDQLQSFLRRLSAHVRAIQPVRISDRLARFRLGNINASTALELRYTARELAHTVERVRRYQDWIGQPLLLENYPSTEPHGCRQLEFMAQVQQRSGCDLMFDVSSAVVAELNRVLPLSAWLDYLGQMRQLHVHVGGYRLDRSGWPYRDSHDSPVSPESITALWRVARATRLATLCYERDHNKSVAALSRDLRLIEAVMGTTSAPARATARALGLST